jgi:hypothetical protein
MQANDREKLMGNYVNSLIFVSLAFIYFLALILIQTFYYIYQKRIFSDTTNLVILFWGFLLLVFVHLIAFLLIDKDQYDLSFLLILISISYEIGLGLKSELAGNVGKPFIIESLFDFLLLIFLRRSRSKNGGGIWHYKTDKGILLTYISKKKINYEIYRINFIFHYFVMTIYAIILLIAISLNFVFESSSGNLTSHFNFDMSPDIFTKFLLALSPLLSQLPQIFFKKNSEKNLNENFTQILEIDVSLKCSFDKCSLWVKNKSERYLYEIHIPLDLLPDELRKVIAKENENPKIPILEPGKEATLAEINRELLVTYLKKNELDFDYAKILYRDTYYRWYSLYIELHKDHVIPIVPTYEKLSLLDAFKMFIIPL